MNIPGPVPAKAPQPPQPRPVITSLTSNANSQTPGTTSLAEALATSVADFVCDNRQKKNDHVTTAAAPPKSTATSPTITTASNNNAASRANYLLTFGGGEKPNTNVPTVINAVAAAPPKSTSTTPISTTTVSSKMPSHAARPQIVGGIQPAKPTQPTANNSSKNGIATAPPKSAPKMAATPAVGAGAVHPRIVSGEHPKPTRSPPRASHPPHLKLTPQTANGSACSSMSSAVADLASGMFNFRPTTTTNANASHKSNGGTGNISSSGNGSSAPIISGTAAAVLALQSNFHDTAPAIVSNTSPVASGGRGSGGTAPDPPRSHSKWGGSQGGGASRSLTPQGSPTSTNSPNTPTSSSHNSPKFPTRYSDGAPIIAGTAAAQMEAIATATAARITSITNDGGSKCDDVASAVASLGTVGAAPYTPSKNGIGLGEPSSRNHGFTPGAHYYGGSFKGGDRLVLTGASMSSGASVAGGSHRALSWVDYGNGSKFGACPTRVSSEDSPAACHVSVVSASVQCRSSSTPTMARVSATNAKPGGGMDILAEITCHAPPMSVPVTASQASTTVASSASTNMVVAASSYQQYHSPSAAIPSYQEIYQQQQHHRQQRPQNSAVVPSASFSSPGAMPSSSATASCKKRVSAIPSYQEIYREMGLSSPRQPPSRTSSSHPEKQGNNAHYSTSNYSIEEVQVEHAGANCRPMSALHHGTRSSTGGHQPRTHSSSGDSKNSVDDAGSSSSKDASNGAMSHRYAQHRAPTVRFGHVRREDVEEGKELYTRSDLMHLCGHLEETKDVHGNMREGCDSLVVGSLEREIREGDGLAWFLYSTDRANGGGALCQSYHKRRPVRVFRSSLLGGRFAPPYLDVEDDEAEDSDVAHRYDGLYMVRAVWDAGGSETESLPAVSGPDGWQTYFLTRVPKKPLEKERVEMGVEYNFMGLQELWSCVQKMKGVRRPRKFEIPQPPVKLGPMKKVAITGAFKDRKCPGYVKPIPVVAAPPAPKPSPAPTAPPQAKCPRTVPDTCEKNRRREEEAESETSSSSEEEKEPKACPVAEEDSDSDSSRRHPLRHHTPLSARTPSKALTPRPRLNSMSQPKKAPPPVANDEDDGYSSDDSEVSTPTPKIAARRDKRKKPTPSRPDKIKVPNTAAATLSDVCTFFPKRASAARAEAANRNMFGKKSFKRKTSESSTTATPKHATRAASAAAVGGRKKAKVMPIQHGDDEDDNQSSSSSSSEEDQPDPDVVDQSVLTVGSRVLVLYKGSLFKATIRKRRFKNNRHDFLIHYDGNKRTNVHWVALDRISEILEIKPLDAPAKRKRHEELIKKGTSANAGMSKKKAGGNNSGGKMNSLAAKRESHESEGENDENNFSRKDLSRDEPIGDRTAPVKKDGAQQTDNIKESHANNADVKLIVKEANLQVEEKELNKQEQKNPNVLVKIEVATIKSSRPSAILIEEDNDEKPVSNDEADGDGLEKTNDKVPKANADKVDMFVNMNHETKPAKSSLVNTEKEPAAKTEEQKHQKHLDPECEKIDAEESVAPADSNDLAPNHPEQPKIEEGEGVSNALPMSKDDVTPNTDGVESKKPIEGVSGDECDTNVQKQPLETQETTITTSSCSTAMGDEFLAASATAAVSNQKDPLQILAEEAESDVHDDCGESDKDTTDENNSMSSSGNATIKQHEQASSASGESTSELKYPVGSHVYVEYRQIFYSSTILKTRRKRGATEYLVHYEGYKKSSNRWVRENALHKVNVSTTQRFEEQRLIPADILYESPQPPVFSMTTRRKKAATEMGRELQPPFNNSITSQSSVAAANTHKKPPPRRMRSDTLETISNHQSALETIEPGVAFLPGSMVFVEWSGALYLAKMVRKRYSGDRAEYLISYEGFNNNHDAWVTIRKIYEVNHQTKRAFKQINSVILTGAPNVDVDKLPPNKRRAPPPPGPRRRETRKKTQDDLNTAIAASNCHAATSTSPTTRNNSLDNSQSSSSSRGVSSSSRADKQPTRQASQIDMQGIEPGVEFLPGSTLFAEYRGELCLAKMLKKRGKGDYMEYLLQYNSNVLKTKKQKSEEIEEDSRCWVSTSLVYEINPQTKRMFRKLSKSGVRRR